MRVSPKAFHSLPQVPMMLLRILSSKAGNVDYEIKVKAAVIFLQ